MGKREDNNTASLRAGGSIVFARRPLRRVHGSVNTAVTSCQATIENNKGKKKEETISSRMPSAQETTTYLIEVMPADTTQDFLSRDVDLLVSQIKENLRLSSLKAKSRISFKSRPSPYWVPSRSWGDPASTCEACEVARSNNNHHHTQNPHHHHHHHHHRDKNNASRDEDEEDEDNPYVLLRELLRKGRLIKEAVRRLQNSNQEDEDEDVEEEVERVYRRKPYFYDSEDEPVPQVYEPLEL